ncbi:sigma-70 family RNA polymerase sigma factor [Pseudomonas sp. CrR25]|nr:sigma-70 family RNA polymerase sigma factor [Pseudomonas sp. CrR25]
MRGRVGSTMVTLNPLLRMATIAGVEVAVKLHIARGDDLDARDGGGATPLMLASARRKKGVVRLLLAAGANPELLDSEGRGALAYSEKGGCPECITLLREALDAFGQVSESGVSDEGSPLPGESTPPTATTADASQPSLSGEPECYEAEDETAGVETQVDDVAVSDARPILGLSIPKEEPCLNNTAVHLAVEPVLAVEKGVHSNFIDIDDEPLDSGFESDWVAESEAVAPKGDETVAEGISALQGVIGRHQAIDTDVEWGDVELFLPERALPLASDDREGIRGLLFRGLREGTVSETALVDACRGADTFRNEEAERLLTFVLGDLGIVIDEWEELACQSDLKGPTAEEELVLAEALEFIEDLASGCNDPLRYYVKGLKADLLLAEEEISLGREMEDAGAQAMDALSCWPSGLSVVFEAADRVLRGEADSETFSSEPGPSEGGEASDGNASSDEEAEDEGYALAPGAAAFVSAISEARSAGSDPVQIRLALTAACLSRGFLLELARNATADPAGKAFISAVRRQSGARERMILSNLRLVYSTARKYMWSDLSFDDLVQEGNIGLIKAVERYDWRKGFRFSTYAMWWIRQQIARAINNKAMTIRVPVHVHKMTWPILRERALYENKTGRPETEIETSRRMGIPIEKVRFLLAIFDDVISLDELSGDSGLPLIDTLMESESSDPALAVEEDSLWALLLNTVDELDERLAEVIKLRFGLGGEEPMTLEEVGLRFNLTRERIRQIESKALGKLSSPAKKEKLALYMGDQFELKHYSVPPSMSEDAPKSLENKGSRERKRAQQFTGSLKDVSQPDKQSVPVRSTETVSDRQYELLSGLLEEARSLGLQVEDARSRGGKILVSLPAHSDAATRSIARKMTNAGFTLHFGNTYVK